MCIRDRDSSVKEFLLQKFADASNNFLSWLIISFVFVLVFSTFVSQYIPIVPKKISDIQVLGFEPVSYTHLDVYKRQALAFPVVVLLISKNLDI